MTGKTVQNNGLSAEAIKMITCVKDSKWYPQKNDEGYKTEGKQSRKQKICLNPLKILLKRGYPKTADILHSEAVCSSEK